jgi:serine phosphatase RsbU (regulator of sigma subunit)
MNAEITEHSLIMAEINHDLDKLVNDLSEKNKNITDSLTYAKRIQMAMLPNENRIKELFSDFFVFYQPREIVSGDFFWLATDGRRKLLAAIDCTGHGVPGAFMSTLGSALLNQIVNVQEIWSPAEILNQLNKHIAETLNQLNGENRDGMDAAICVYDQTDETLLYAGARNPLVYVRDGELHEIKADKNSVGGFSSFRPIKNFVNHTIQAEKQLNTPYYIFSDGYQDQFGGSEGKKFSSKRLKELFFDIHDKPMQEQKSIVSNRFEDWIKQGTEKQIDDVLVIGFRI